MILDTDIAGRQGQQIDANQADQVRGRLQRDIAQRLLGGRLHQDQAEVDILDRQSNRIRIAIIPEIDDTITIVVLEIGADPDEQVHAAGGKCEHIHGLVGGRRIIQLHRQAILLGESETAGHVDIITNGQGGIGDRDPDQAGGIIEINTVGTGRHRQFTAGQFAEVDRRRLAAAAIGATIDLDAVTARTQLERLGTAKIETQQLDRSGTGAERKITTAIGSRGGLEQCQRQVDVFNQQARSIGVGSFADAVAIVIDEVWTGTDKHIDVLEADGDDLDGFIRADRRRHQDVRLLAEAKAAAELDEAAD